MKNKINKCGTVLMMSLLFSISSYSQNSILEWKQYSNIEEIGFSKKIIDSIISELKNTETASLLVVYNGNILMSYGDNTRRYAIHSIRKSIMNAMYGIEIENGNIALNQTLEELSIDDIGRLTTLEKKATVKDLLSARSGVYHPSAYFERSQAKNLPKRGSHAHGTYWAYNNWDFNSLITIYEQQSGKNFFEAFKNEIAEPLGMEDFRLIDTFSRLELDKSMHPAYLFKISSRDLGRFGQLYLNKGKWNNSNLLTEDWINKSIYPHTTGEDLRMFNYKGSYGFLFWSSKILGKDYFYASGAGGHRIIIIPDEQMVIVHRVNTYEGKGVGNNHIDSIVKNILNAKTEVRNAKKAPKLIAYSPILNQHKNIYIKNMDKYLGTYKHKFLGEMSIETSNGNYILQNGIGIFNLFKISENSFYVEDIEGVIEMIKTSDESKRNLIEPVKNENGQLEKVLFYY